MNGKITIINPTADDFITLGVRVQALGYALIGAIRDGAPALEQAAAALIDYGYIIDNISTDNYDALIVSLHNKGVKKTVLAEVSSLATSSVDRMWIPIFKGGRQEDSKGRERPGAPSPGTSLNVRQAGPEVQNGNPKRFRRPPIVLLPGAALPTHF